MCGDSLKYRFFILLAALFALLDAFLPAAGQNEPVPVDEEEPLMYTLTVNYIRENEDEPFQISKHRHEPGYSYNIASPVVEGYLPDVPRLFGSLDEDSEITVAYHVESFCLTVHYRLLDGQAAAPDYHAEEVFGTEYSIPSPAVSGNVPVTEEISGVMPGRDVEWTVFYVDRSALVNL